VLVGINHPWVSCGHDFGPRPPQWGGLHAKRDWGAVEAELREWRALGLEVSRIWVLAGGVNFPAGEDPRDRFGVAPVERAGGLVRERLRERFVRKRFGDVWERFVLGDAELPPLPQSYLDDFRALLRACENAGVKLMPSLTSFEMFHPIDVQHAGVCSRGRAALVFGDRKLADPAQLRRFLDVTLSPLLEVSREHPEAIYAWEVMNEPDWVVEGGPVHARIRDGKLSIMPKTVPRQAMCALLEQAVDRIVDAGFLSSIGFKIGNPRWVPRPLMRKLGRLGDEGRYVHQLHHYPSLYEPWPLPRYEQLPVRPCLVGEFPTVQAPLFGLHKMAWPEGVTHLRHEQDPERYLRARLELIERRGYDGALLWGGRSTDGMTAWGEPQKAQVASYSSGA